MTVANDVAEVIGQVTRDGKPGEGALVVFVPVDTARRTTSRYNLTAQVAADGAFHLNGIVPGDYYVFAVEPLDDASYFDPEFPERNRNRAERLTAKAKEKHALNLKVSEVQ